MTKKIDELSVFFPAYNEEKNIKKTVLDAKEILEKLINKWEILIINDGSKDDTGEIAKELVRSDNRIKVITHTPNKGYGATLTSGLYASKYSWIAFSDSDGQFDFSEITKFFQKQAETGSDLVIGYYLKRQVPRLTIVTSKIWELFVYVLFGLKVRDVDCAFKLVSKRVIEKIPKLTSQRGAFISSELLVKAKKAGFTISEVGLT